MDDDAGLLNRQSRLNTGLITHRHIEEWASEHGVDRIDVTDLFKLTDRERTRIRDLSARSPVRQEFGHKQDPVRALTREFEHSVIS